MPQRHRFSALAVGLALLLSACIDYTERIVIARDGSASIELRLRAAPSFLQMMGRSPAMDTFALLLSEEALRASLPPGVRLERHTEGSTPGRRHYINDLAVDDVTSLDVGGSPAFQGQTFTVERLDDGSLRYRRRLDFTTAARDPEFAAMLRENRMGIAGILDSAPFVFELETPLGVLETNGRVSGGRVAWQYSLLDLLKQPVTQEVLLAAPTGADLVLGALRRLLRPATFPVVALVLLGLFFASVRRPNAPA